MRRPREKNLPAVAPAESLATETALSQRSRLTCSLAPLLSRGEFQAAFERIYRALFSRIYHYILARIPDSYQAEDLVQEVFCAVFQALPRFDPSRASVETWVYAICCNKLKKYYRDHKLLSSLDDEGLAQEIVSSDDLETAALLQETRDYLAQLISRLSIQDQQLVIMRYFQDASSEEMAVATGLSTANVRVRLYRALKKMDAMSKE